MPVRLPAPFEGQADMGGGIVERRHAGGVARVTTLERALVDVFDAPDKGGGWEEIWRSLEMVEFFDLDAVIGVKENRRLSMEADTGGCAGADYISGLKHQSLGQD